jgi:pimeloyl-ACP methyl ester carboxylesterase
MINIFRSQMRRPLIGIGHSMGATNIVQLALLHPRLFSSVVCIEPILNKEYRGMNFSAAYGLSYRKDVWPSRAAAMAESRKSEVQRTWDERVMKRWECYAFCDLPTLLYPTAPEAIIESAAEGGTSPVTLTTTKHHGVRSYARAAFASPERPLEDLRTSQKSHVGLTQAAFDAMHAPVYRPECIYTFQQLPFLRPSCLFIYGAESHFSNAKPKSRADKLNSTGTSAWGSGGANGGKVGEVVLEGGGHYIVLEKPAAVAGETSRWVDARLAEWQEEDAAERKAWDRVPSKERARVDDAWLFWVKEYYKKTKL